MDGASFIESSAAKRRNAIVLGGTKDMAFAMGAFLASFFDVNSHINTEAVIFHDGLDALQQSVLSGLCRHACRFEYYVPPFDIDETWHKNIKYFTPMVFSKYECLRLLGEYQTVVWFDYDMVVAKPLDMLFRPVEGGIRAILAPNMGTNIPEHPQNSDLLNYKDCVGIHSPCLALYDTLKNAHDLYEWCLRATQEYSHDLGCPDQAVLSVMVNKFCLDVYPLVFELYSPHPKDRGKRLSDRYAKIWHSYQNIKYWDQSFHDGQWYRYYCAYLSGYLEETFGVHIRTFLDARDGFGAGEDAYAAAGDVALLHGCAFPLGNVELVIEAAKGLARVGAQKDAQILLRLAQLPDSESVYAALSGGEDERA